jgi:hypothetical protein
LLTLEGDAINTQVIGTAGTLESSGSVGSEIAGLQLDLGVVGTLENVLEVYQVGL